VSIRRAATIGSALVVAAIAAYASYSHMRHLALAYGQDQAVATLLPVSVDGLMVVATIALGDGRHNRWSAWLAFWSGVAASVVANVLAAEPSMVARTISAWPAVAFLLVVEVITRGGRIRSSGGQLVAVEEITVAPAAAVELVDDRDVQEHTEPATSPVPVKRPARRPSAADRVAKAASRTPNASAAQIAARLNLSERTVQRHLRTSGDDTTPTAEEASGQVNNHRPALVTADQAGGTP
jgi:hypothetical protein